MVSLKRKALRFILISGCGWLMDTAIYMLLTTFASVPVQYANIISSLPAITFVFFMSTKKAFEQKESRIGLQYKYIVYVVYQAVLVVLISMLAGFLFRCLEQSFLYEYELIATWGKFLIKCLITPITMTVNFFVMHFLIEKI